MPFTKNIKSRPPMGGVWGVWGGVGIGGVWRGKVKTKRLNDWSHKELMALPVRKWDESGKEYDSLLLTSTRRKHDRGWATIAIIGLRNHQPEEIACACCDDIEWILPNMKRFGVGGWYSAGQFRTDCAFRSGALHVWKRGARFKVGNALSSTTIELVEGA